MKYKVLVCYIVVTAIVLGSSSFSSYRPSPLAKLMKKMMLFLDKEKSRITNGKPALKFPADSSALLRAKITPGKQVPDEHKQYVADFYLHLDNYYRAENKTQREVLYNDLVQSCVSCHRHECPGPIELIKKNLIKETNIP